MNLSQRVGSKSKLFATIYVYVFFLQFRTYPLKLKVNDERACCGNMSLISHEDISQILFSFNLHVWNCIGVALRQ